MSEYDKLIETLSACWQEKKKCLENMEILDRKRQEQVSVLSQIDEIIQFICSDIARFETERLAPSGPDGIPIYDFATSSLHICPMAPFLPTVWLVEQTNAIQGNFEKQG